MLIPPKAEEWQSGRMRSLGKRVYRKVSQVQILSPPSWVGERFESFLPAMLRKARQAGTLSASASWEMSMKKLPKSFYQQPAIHIAKDFLGKYLVFNSAKGKVSGKIIDVEAYPAFSDKVSHGNKRTTRTEVMYHEGGYAYVYIIYGTHHQFAVVVNKESIPEVVFIRAVTPDEGVKVMKENFGKKVKNVRELTKSPGNLCKSFGVNMSLYGEDLTGDQIFIEDRGMVVEPKDISYGKRVGVNNILEGSEQKLRFFLKI